MNGNTTADAQAGTPPEWPCHTGGMQASPKPVLSPDNVTEAAKSARASSILLAIVLAWECIVLLLTASRKRFWYDELVTLHVASLPSFSVVWKALRAGADGMTPGFYAVFRMFKAIPADAHVTLRLPSILGYLMTLLGLWWFARKRLPSALALAGVLIVVLSPFRAFATEARPYALLAGLLAIAAVLWQNIGRRWFIAPLFALFLTLGTASHYLAVVAIEAFAAAEIAIVLETRRIRAPVWIAFAAAACPFFATLPVLLQFRASYGKTFWSRATWLTAVQTYDNYLGLSLLPVIVLVAFIGIAIVVSLAGIGRADRAHENGFTKPEIVLIAGFLFYPAALAILTKILGSGYTPRYGWPAIFGLALGSVYLLRFTKPASAYLLAALFIASIYQAGADFKNLPAAGSTIVDEHWRQLEALSRSEPGIPVVIASGLTYLEAVQYAPPGLRERLIEVADADKANQRAGADTTDETNIRLARFIPLEVESLESFEAAHPRFILYSGGVYDWLTGYLADKKYQLTLLAPDKTNPVYIVRR